jgi:hypothetical protein
VIGWHDQIVVAGAFPGREQGDGSPIADPRPAPRQLRHRGADAVQLGAALAVAEDQPASLQVVTLDDRLAQTAEREGFRIVNPDRG